MIHVYVLNCVMDNSESINLTCVECEVKSGCFKKLTTEQLLLANHSRVELEFRKKEIVAKQGAFATHLMFVKKGVVKLYMEGCPGNNDLIINIFPQGRILGISSIFGDSTFHYSISALENSTLCLIEINTVRELMKQNNDFALSLFRRLSRSTSHAYNHLFNLTNKQSNGRIASVFVYLAKEVYHSKKFKLSLTRKDLAEFTGMSTMNAVRVLNDQKKNNLIREEDGYLEILDFPTLEHISKIG